MSRSEERQPAVDVLRSLASALQLISSKATTLRRESTVTKEGQTFLIVDTPEDSSDSGALGIRLGLNIHIGLTVTNASGETLSWGTTLHQTSELEWLIERHHSVLTAVKHVEVDLPDVQCENVADVAKKLPDLVQELLAENPAAS